MVALADAIKDNGAISSVNLLKNDIGIDQAHVLVSILKDHPTLKSLCGNQGNEVELDMSGKMKGAADAIMLVLEIIDNGALSVLSLKDNSLCNKEAGKTLSEMLAGNTVLKELDVSSNSYYCSDGAGFAQELAVGLGDDRALSVLSLKSNQLHADGGKALAEGLKGNTMITELDISSNTVGEDSYGRTDMSGVIALADAIPNMGAMSVYTFSGDSSNSKAVTMNTSMTEADFSEKYLGVSGAIMLLAFLPKCM
jgi:hypothetical protein